VIKKIQEKGELQWQQEWNVSTKGETTKSFFPNIGERKTKRLEIGAKFYKMVIGHGTLRSYYYRFKIRDDTECVCRMGPQTTHHLIWDCTHLLKQRETPKNRIRKADGKWQLSKTNLANNYTKWFQIFVNSINFEIV
jgi:hypothetical protein